MVIKISTLKIYFFKSKLKNMQKVMQEKANRVLKLGGLAVFVFGLVLALPTHAATTTSLSNGDGNYHSASSWTTVGTSTEWMAVVSNDGNSSYITEDVNDRVRTFAVANAGLSAGITINSVTFNVIASGTNSGIKLRLEKGTNNNDRNDSATVSLTNSYAGYSRTDLVNPFTHEAWTLAEVNEWTTKFGIQYVDQGSNDEARVTQIYVVVDYSLPPDTTAPVIGSHDTVTVEAAASNTPVTYTLPTATDDVDGSVVVSCSPVSGALFLVGTTPVLCSASDAAGNIATSTFNVVVQDTTAPVINTPVHGFAEAAGPDGAIVNYPDQNAVDAVDGTFAATCLPARGSLFPLGENHVVCTAVDVAGNEAVSTTINVTVWDHTKPVIGLIGDSNPSLVVGDVYVDAGATSTDIVDGDLTSQIVTVGADVDTHVRGFHIITYNVTDAHGNVADQVTRAVYVSDVNAPVFGDLPNVTAEATSSAGVVVDYGIITAIDDVDGEITAVCSPASGTVFSVGSTLVSCTATDLSVDHNTSMAGFNVIVQDTTAPEITIAVPFLVVEAASSAGAEVSYTASATDLVDGSVALVECSPEPDTMFALGETVITCTAADTHGNRATSTVTVTVRDTTPPELTLPADQTFEATGFFTSPTLVLATTTDVIDSSPIITYSPTSSFPLGITEVRWTATDASGNARVGWSNVRIIDTTNPVITLNGDASINLTVGSVYSEQGASVTDNHDTEISVIIAGDVVNTAVVGTYHVTYDAQDSGDHNAEQKVRTVVVSSAPAAGGSSGIGSAFVPPTPPSFGDHPIIIGAGLGNTSTVNLTFDVQNASWVAISETPNFVGASWLPYATGTTFTLSAGNTEHKLYIKFRRVNGGETKVQEVTVLLNSPSTLIQAVLGVKITRLNELANKLKFGNRGAEVRELQTLLKQAGYFPARQIATGYYGPITRAAVKKYLAAIK